MNNKIITTKTALKYSIKQSVFNCLQIRFSQPLCMKILARPFCVHIWNGPAGTKGPFFVLLHPDLPFFFPAFPLRHFLHPLQHSLLLIKVHSLSTVRTIGHDHFLRLCSLTVVVLFIHMPLPSSSTYATSSASATPYPTPTFIIPLHFSYFPRDKTEDVGRSPKSTYRTRRKWLLERRG